MKIDEKRVEEFVSGMVSLFAIGVGLLVVSTAFVFMYSIIKSIFF